LPEGAQAYVCRTQRPITADNVAAGYPVSINPLRRFDIDQALRVWAGGNGYPADWENHARATTTWVRNNPDDPL